MNILQPCKSSSGIQYTGNKSGKVFEESEGSPVPISIAEGGQGFLVAVPLPVSTAEGGQGLPLPVSIAEGGQGLLVAVPLPVSRAEGGQGLLVAVPRGGDVGHHHRLGVPTC